MGSKKTYSNEDVTIIWQPEKCIHSGICVQGLPEVFNPKLRPWLKPEHASSAALVKQVRLCPSGALSIQDEKTASEKLTKIEVNKNGPVIVHGNAEIKHADGSVEIRENLTALCRCGHSSNKPFCDGTHRKIAFEG